MKLFRKAAVIAAASALLLTGCAADSGSDTGGETTEVNTDAEFEAGTTMAKLNEAGKITIGTKFDQPLFGLKGPSGEPVGFDVEIGKMIAAELGIDEGDIDWIEAVSANREPFLESGKADLVVATYTINDTRKEVISFAGPYYTAGQDLLVLAGNPDGITGIDDVLDKTVCSVTGSTSIDNLKEAGVTDILATDAYSNCLEPLRSGEAVAVSTDNVILAGLADQNEGEFEVVDNPFTEEPYGIGLGKDDTDFRNFINDILEKSYEDGRWASAWEATAGVVLSTPAAPTLDRY